MAVTSSPRYSVSTAPLADWNRLFTSSTTATFSGLGFSMRLLVRRVERPITPQRGTGCLRSAAQVVNGTGYEATSSSRKRLGSTLTLGPIVGDTVMRLM